MKRSMLAAALAATFLLGPVARADEAWDKQADAEIAYFKKHSKKARDPQVWAELAMSLVGTGHPAAAKELGETLLKDRDLEHQMILADVLSEFTAHEESRVAAGEALLKALEKGKFEVDVVDSIANSLGKLKFQPAVFALCELLKKGGDPWLLVTVVRAVGNLEDKRALPTLLELWERHPVGYSWETGEVTVDTGASGTADQDAAEAAWKAKYGSVQKKGKPPVMFKVYIQELAKSVNKITGENIETAAALRAWMEEHIEELKELGVEIPKYKGPPRKDPEDEKKK